MRILAICGSPRKGGNTDTLIDKALEGAEGSGADTEKIYLEDLDIAPCSAEEYDSVNDEGFSVVNDDIHIIFSKIREADGLILGSPIFFGSLSAQVKTMIDRFQCVWLSKVLLKKELYTIKKPGAFICAEATQREDFFENARSIVRHFFATISIDYKEELFCPGVDSKDSVLKKPECLEKAYELGKKLAVD